MRFLADESCDAAVVRALQGADHDVESIAHTMRGATDATVLATARLGGRVLITEDKDFGEIVFAARKPAVGVLLLRYPSSARSEMAAVVVELVAARSEELVGAFTVIGPGGVRTTPLPRT